MNVSNFLSRLPSRYWGYFALSLWSVATLFFLRQDFYNLDEGGANSLLLIWSVADNVASSALTFGIPDLRVLLFMPVGVLWTGSVFAPKLFAVICMAFTARLFYLWEQRSNDTECALLATGLLLISPLTLQQIDMLSPGIYLLLAFALGAWLNDAYRTTPHPFGGWYFAQLFVSAFSVSLHPAGLAYPLALLFSWHKEPLDNKQKKYFFIGVIFIVLFTLLVRMGWNDLEWLQNPVQHLATIALGTSLNDGMTNTRWVTGMLLLASLAVVVIKQYRALWSDFTGRILLIALILGAAVGDLAWATIALVTALYFGLPLLLRLRLPFSSGFVHHRGATLLLVFILSTLFMRADKAHYEVRQSEILSDQDQLIRTLANEAESMRKAADEGKEGVNTKRLRVASQWPSRTMIACKCDTLPLPPAAKDAQAQLSMLSSITHLLFNPQQPNNMVLARNLAMIGGAYTETIALQPGGVVLHFKSAAVSNSGEQ